LIVAFALAQAAARCCTATMDPYSINYLLKFNPVK